MYLYDYHMHSLNSLDGHDHIADLSSKAIKAGLKEIAITDHFEPSLGNEDYPFYKPEKYFKEVTEAKAKFKGKINIKCAIELGQPHIYSQSSLKVIEGYPYDYVLASVHKIKNDLQVGQIEYDHQNLKKYSLEYLDELKLLAKWNKYDCIGHLDLIKRYAAIYKLKVCFLDYREKLEEILKIIIENGKGIEVNTSGLRQYSKECLPNLDIISLYKELGGEIITVGSDAHYAEDVGKGISDAIEMIKQAGFKYMTLYTKRNPSMLKIAEKPAFYCFEKKIKKAI